MARITGQGLTVGNAPIVDNNGVMQPQFRQLIITLLNRTGGTTGEDINNVTATADAALASAAASLKKSQNLADVQNLPTAKANLGLGSVASGNTVAGWTNPTGTGARSSIDGDWATVVSNPPTQAQMISMRDQVIALQHALAQLIRDLETAKVISP